MQPPKKVLVRERTHPHSGLPFADRFPNGYVLSEELAAERTDTAEAFALVRSLWVGATGFEPVTPSVSVNAGLPLC
jgi:hypothetical protein